jgi:hypothetical protein
MVEAYSLDGQMLSKYTNLHEYAQVELWERLHTETKLSLRLNTIYVAAYMTIKNPGRYTYSQYYRQNIMFKETAKKIPTPNKTI